MVQSPFHPLKTQRPASPGHPAHLLTQLGDGRAQLLDLRLQGVHLTLSSVAVFFRIGWREIV